MRDDRQRAESRALLEGPTRAPARSYLRNIGYTERQLRQPVVGVSHSWTDTSPCNINHRELANRVKTGVGEAGGTPMEFSTIAVADAIVMGTAGMRASLISREVIADSIELMARAHHFDALVCLTGCDKTTPAAAMALARLDRPAVIGYSGTVMPGRFRGRDVASGEMYEAVGEHAAGLISAARPRPGREPHQRSGALAHYALLVGSASQGAVLAGLDDTDDTDDTDDRQAGA